MKIKSNLVFDKHSGYLMGFLDFGDPKINYSILEESDDTVATLALVFYLRGLATDLKYTFAFFPTESVTFTQLLALFWEAMCILELTCNLWIIATTSDGVSPNKRFYRLHKALQKDDGNNKTINLFAMWRFIYCFSDAPHVIKTLRNCLSHSGAGKCTRYMWNTYKYIFWQHATPAFYDDL